MKENLTWLGVGVVCMIIASGLTESFWTQWAIALALIGIVIVLTLLWKEYGGF